jgi:hypothetical protein
MDAPMEEPMEEEPMNPQETAPIEGEEVEDVHGLANEFKTVPGVTTQPEIEDEPEPEPMNETQPQGEDEGVLFGDAPEQRTKKLAYN